MNFVLNICMADKEAMSQISLDFADCGVSAHSQGSADLKPTLTIARFTGFCRTLERPAHQSDLERLQ